MDKELKKWATSEICRVGMGGKYHIRGRGQLTLCGCGPMEATHTLIIAVREDWDGLCQNCIREYKRIDSACTM